MPPFSRQSRTARAISGPPFPDTASFHHFSSAAGLEASTYDCKAAMSRGPLLKGVPVHMIVRSAP